MIRTQIQLPEDQLEALERLAAAGRGLDADFARHGFEVVSRGSARG